MAELSEKAKKIEGCIEYLNNVIELCNRNNFLQVALPERIIKEYNSIMRNSIESAKSQSSTSDLADKANEVYKSLVEGKIVKPLELNEIKKVIESIQDFYNKNYTI